MDARSAQRPGRMSGISSLTVPDGGDSGAPNFGSSIRDRSADSSFLSNTGSLIVPRGDGGLGTGAITPRGLADTLGPGSAWEKDRPDCSLCGVIFGKLNRQHHCRMCGHCVCATCSPSVVTLDGWRGTQRVCNECVSLAPRAQNIRERVLQVGRQLHNIRSEVPELYGDASTTLADAVQYCEREMLPLKVGHSRATQAIQGMHAALMELAEKPPTLLSDESLEEMVVNVESLVEPVGTKLQEAEIELNRERAARTELEAQLASLTSQIAVASAQIAAANRPLNVNVGRPLATAEPGARDQGPVDSGPMYQLLADARARTVAREEQKNAQQCVLL